MVIAALDLGSNTIKISVAAARDGRLDILGETARITRIGEGLDKNKRLLPEAIERTIAGLKELVAFARGLGATTIGCVGTAGLRGAANAAEFLDRAKRECGLDVEVIDGLREAELAFRAPALSYGPGPIIVTDIGGRSTEIVTGSAEGPVSAHSSSTSSPAVQTSSISAKIDARISLELGSVRLTERFLTSDPPKADQLNALKSFLASAFGAAPAADEGAKLIGVSGTVVSMIGLQLDVDAMDDAVKLGEGNALRRDRLVELIDELAAKPAAQRIRGTVLPAGRADVIVAGAMIALALIDHYEKTEMLASNRGVRYGLLYELAAAHGR